MTTLAEDNSNDLWGHPRGLYICFATELWERFSFYGMKTILVVFMQQHMLDAAGRPVRTRGGVVSDGSALICTRWRPRDGEGEAADVRGLEARGREAPRRGPPWGRRPAPHLYTL